MQQYKNRLQDIDVLQRQIMERRPLKRHELKELREYYRIGLTWSSNAIEGNTLSESETKVVLEDGITIGGKPLKDHLETVGHSEAFDLLFRLAKKKGVTEEDVRSLHRLFYHLVDQKNAGKYRKRNVIVTGARINFPSPAELKPLMHTFLEELERERSGLHVVEYAGRLHLRLVTIHPFVDGNGRTARLLMNLALLQEGYPITVIPPVVRGDYIAAIQRANEGDERQFLNFISCMVWEAQREYLRLLDGLGVT